MAIGPRCALQLSNEQPLRRNTKLAVVKTNLVAVKAGQTRVEAAVLRLQDSARIDVRLVSGALITVAIGLATMMAHGFRWI